MLASAISREKQKGTAKEGGKFTESHQVGSPATDMQSQQSSPSANRALSTVPGFSTRARQRFAESYVTIIVGVISIIQSLAFSHLIVQFPRIYEYAIATRDYKVLAHFLLSFAVILRVFQTYVTAALDYEEWQINFLDIILIFVVGAAQYFTFSVLDAPDFRVVEFHQRLSVISTLGILGYAWALFRVKQAYDKPATMGRYLREARLQIANIAGVAGVFLISALIIFGPTRADTEYTVLALMSALILSGNIIHSIGTTLGSQPAGKPPVVVRGAQQEDVLSLSELIVESTSDAYPLLSVEKQVLQLAVKHVLLARDGRHVTGYRSFCLAIHPDQPAAAGYIVLVETAGRARFPLPVRLLVTVLETLGITTLASILKTVNHLWDDSLARVESSALAIACVGVMREFRHVGVGRSLIQHAKMVAIDRGKTSLSANVPAGNHGLLTFLKSQGFREGRQRNGLISLQLQVRQRNEKNS